MAFADWSENPPSFISRYDVANTGDWNKFYNRYTAGNASAPLLRIIEIGIDHGVQSVLVETRYIDADWRSEHARFYSTTYTRYPSVAHRAHFFTKPLPSDLGDLSGLTDAYKGYSVLRPLAVQPVGRTMIEPPSELADGIRCEAIEYVDILGWKMVVRGMPFISQDAQYMRCAHSDMWMALRHAYLRHQLGQKLPEQIHAATVGGLVIGRQLPSEGLSVPQMMAGMASLGLSPAILSLPQSQADNTAQGILGLFGILCRYVNSNITPMVVSSSHVWLIVGYTRQPSAAHSGVTLYRHDDAAGPYLRIDDPWNEPQVQHQPWQAALLPLPPKIYMTAERAELSARWWFERWMNAAPSDNPAVLAKANDHLTFRAYGINSSEFKFGLASRSRFDATVANKYRMTPMPRNLWVIEAVDRNLRDSTPDCILGEVLIDPTAAFKATPDEPGIIAAHAPGFLWITTPDVDIDSQETCATTPYASGRPVYSTPAI